ncbi:MAG: type II secretion system minor pseudopilin GspK [Pseudomonadales bacterium]|nr:type II secretion system minor pseudopilin GspK [Pseudomonadales bacterium]
MQKHLSERKGTKQKGTALISVLLIFAVCTVLAVEMQERQHLDIRRTTNIMARDQAYLYSAAAEEIAIAGLNEDLKADKKNGVEKDHLGEEWHKEKSLPVEGGAVTASLVELQGKFNINALLASNQDHKKEAQIIFKKLMEDLGLPKSEEGAMPVSDMYHMVLEWMDPDDENDGSLVEGEDYYYQGLEVPYRTSNNYMTNISELRLIRGFTDADIAELEDYVVFIPPDAPLNVNTVEDTLAAILMDDGATAIVSDRPEKGWEHIDDIPKPSASTTTPPPVPAPRDITIPHAVYSEYFLLTATVTINQRTVTNKSVIYRPREPDKNNPIRVIMRDRGRQFHYLKKAKLQN